eukprot:TRINITY_DN2436_c0_g1_i1.p2 TRINITY_DN2436_c0_g1~~TRINITY_DN2436_c0_g1_i1.p2  ORF type:complete len:139 (-),score=39.84 TRINITY_DN2436_c0_g1_i1:102-518(-)
MPLILAIYCFFIFWSVGGLASYHHYLILIGVTTHEDIKGAFNKMKSPYSSSSKLRNLINLYFAPLFVSYKKEEDIIGDIEAAGNITDDDDNNHDNVDPADTDADNDDDDDDDDYHARNRSNRIGWLQPLQQQQAYEPV